MLAVTRTDPAADLRGTYSTALEAADVLQRAGGLAAIADARLGEQIRPALAQVGDVAMCVFERRDTLAVVMGEHLPPLEARTLRGTAFRSSEGLAMHEG